MVEAQSVFVLLLLLPLLQGSVTKLGAYEYFVDESTPVMFNGEFLMFESIVRASPQWAGNWLPAFANCSCYFRIRNIISGEIVVNITETCDHAFGSALVTVDPTKHGLNTFFIFGTPWIRVNSPLPPAPSHQPRDSLSHEKRSALHASHSAMLARVRAKWSGPCAVGNCSVNAFWSTDPKLQRWMAGPGAPLQAGLTVYNNDVAPVVASSVAQTALGLPPHRWVMAIETRAEYTNFLVSNGTSAGDPSAGWVALDPRTFVVPKIVPDIGSCPSIRYDVRSGYYYVLTGGNTIRILRSQNLRDWTLAREPVLTPSIEDCNIASSFFGNYTPGSHEKSLIAKCTAKGFGNDSDVDLMEWVDPRTNTTVVLLQYGSGDQATFGFSNLALFSGTLPNFLQSYFS